MHEILQRVRPIFRTFYRAGEQRLGIFVYELSPHKEKDDAESAEIAFGHVGFFQGQL